MIVSNPTKISETIKGIMDELTLDELFEIFDYAWTILGSGI